MSDSNPADDTARLERIFAVVEAQLGPGDAAWLAMRKDAQQYLRAVRQRLRNSLICRAIAESSADPTAAAKDLAERIEQRIEAIRRYNDTALQSVRPENLAQHSHRLLDALADQIVHLNSFRSIGWRQLYTIASNSFCNSAEKNCNRDM